MIRKANMNDLESIMKIIKSTVEEMKKKTLFQILRNKIYIFMKWMEK